MKVIFKGRAMGKTEEAIRIANETGAYLLVATRQEAERIAPRCKRFPISVSELMGEGLRGSFVRNVVVDNADWILQTFLQSKGAEKIEAITLNDPEAVWADKPEPNDQEGQ